jgi:hypothetical protein
MIFTAREPTLLVMATGEIAEATTIWQKAFEGEALGAALFERMAELVDDDERRAKLDVMRRLEASTLELLRPVLVEKGITTEGEAAAAAQGAELGEAAATQPWNELLASFEPNTATYAAMYGELRSLVPESDHEVVDALLAHERALCEFARRELAGDPDAETAIVALPHVH